MTDSTEYWPVTFRAKTRLRVLTVALFVGLWAWFLYDFLRLFFGDGWPIAVVLFLVLFVVTFRAMWVTFVSLVVFEQDGIVFRKKGRKIKKAYGSLVSVRLNIASPLLTFASGERVRISFVIGGLSWALWEILLEKRPDLIPEDDMDERMGKELVFQVPRDACVLTIAVSGLMFSGSIVALFAIPEVWDTLWEAWFPIFVVIPMILVPMYVFYTGIQGLRKPMIVFARDDIAIVHRNGPTVRMLYSEVLSVRRPRFGDLIDITFKNGETMRLFKFMGDITLAPFFIERANPDADIDASVFPYY